MLGAVDRTEHHLKFKALDLSVNFESIEDPDRLQENCDLESWEKQTKQAVEQVGRLVEVLLAMVKFKNLARMCFEHSMRRAAKRIAKARLKAEPSNDDWKITAFEWRPSPEDIGWVRDQICSQPVSRDLDLDSLSYSLLQTNANTATSQSSRNSVPTS